MSGEPDFEYTDPKQQRDTAIPRFYIEATQNPARSEADGVPRFDDTEMVEILIPGDRKSVVNSIVKPEHKARWPRQYAAFKAAQEDVLDGTPIEQLPGITRSQAEELKYQHVRTVEIMAGLPDDRAVIVTMGGLALRDRCKRWLDSAVANSANEKLAAEKRAADEKVEALQKQLDDLTSRIEAMNKASAKAET